MDTFAAEGEKDKENSIGSTLNQGRIDELKKEIAEMEKDSDRREDEDIQNTILNRRRQIFWLEKLKKFCKINELDFNIHNQKTEIFHTGR